MPMPVMRQKRDLSAEAQSSLEKHKRGSSAQREIPAYIYDPVDHHDFLCLLVHRLELGSMPASGKGRSVR